MLKKKKLIWQIFPSFLIITLLSLSAVTSYSTRYFKNFFLKNSEKELTVRATLFQKRFGDLLIDFNSASSDINSTSSLIDEHCKEIGKTTGTRVTIILPSGKVIGDSFGHVKEMGNHMKRPEIKTALRKEKGVSVRHSATLEENMMYVALPIIRDDGVIAVVRSAVSLSTIDQEIKLVRNSIFIALFFIIIAAAIVSLFVSRRIAHPIEQMKEGAAQFAQGNLQARLAEPASEELSELAKTMNRMAESLDDKIKAFKNRSMELEAVHTSMLEGVIAIDRNEKIITVNEAAARIFDFPATKLKGRYILEVARNIEFQQFLQKVLSTHEPVEDDIIITRDDDLVLNVHSTVLYDTTNSRIGTLIIFHDITRLRRLERMHKDFAANVSHELKTPLTSIKGFIETLQDMIEKDETQEALKFIGIIDKNANRMIDLINDLLALSRLERLQGTGIEFQNHGVLVLIQGAVDTCHDQIMKKNIEIEIDCDQDATAKVDPILMEQAIINLIDNATKYSKANTKISIKIDTLDNEIVIQIKDCGSGIGKEHLSKIFNRFYRVDKARSRNEGGTGLGLAIVKHIVQYHNAMIDVESVKEKGTSFKITIPS